MVGAWEKGCLGLSLNQTNRTFAHPQLRGSTSHHSGNLNCGWLCPTQQRKLVFIKGGVHGLSAFCSPRIHPLGRRVFFPIAITAEDRSHIYGTCFTCGRILFFSPSSFIPSPPPAFLCLLPVLHPILTGCQLHSVPCRGGGDEGESKTGLTGQEVKGTRTVTEALRGEGSPGVSRKMHLRNQNLLMFSRTLQFSKAAPMCFLVYINLLSNLMKVTFCSQLWSCFLLCIVN